MTHYRSGLYRPAFRLLSLIGLLLVTAPLNVTRGAPVVSTTNGYSITSQQGSTTITSLLSPSGIAATQSSTTNGTSGPAIRGAIARYNDGRVFALDYSTMTYVANSLGAAVDHRNAEYSLLYSAVPAYDGGPAITPPAVPPASLQATSLTASIGGAPAAAYLMNYGGKQWRLWYATTLPVPPANIRSALAALEPGGSPATGGAYHVYLPAVGSPNGGPPAGVSPANDVAGRIVLRAELMTGSTWTIVVDTQNVQPANVPDSTFSPPAGFHPGSAHGSSRSSQTAPSVRHGPVQPQDVQANVLQGPGPVSSHPEIYAFYWGNTFNDPSHAPAVSNISQSIPTFYSSGYEGPLAQYGIQSGGLQNTYLVNNDPTAGVGSSDVPAVEAFILNESLTTSAPMFWWEYSGHDPIYTVFVAQSTVDTSSWSGYHFVAPSLNHAVLPFPLSLFVHDAMPYTVIKVPDAALGTQLEAQLYRSQCASSSPPSFCPALAALDKATATGAHEFVEAASDPYPFFGWLDPLKNPWWSNAEISDICENPYPWGSTTVVGSVMVATYWSNLDNACVPPSRPTLTIFDPANGSIIAWATGGPTITLHAYAQDPITGSTTNINWSVDGTPVGTGGTISAHLATPGVHTISASVSGANGSLSTASASVTVAAPLPPTATIASPADGSTYGSDQTIALDGSGFDPADGNLSGNQLHWTYTPPDFPQNNVAIGSGSQVTWRPPYPNGGTFIIKLQATNSANLSGYAQITLHITPPSGNPSVVITQPADGSGFPNGYQTPVTFAANATDSQGNSLAGSAVTWTNDVDGVMGTGNPLQYTFPSGGQCTYGTYHVIATATSSPGHSASTMITVSVGLIC